MTKETEKMILAHVKKTGPKLGLRVLRMAMRQGVEGGWPDTFVFGPNRHLLGVETKRPGEEPTRLQLQRAKEMTAYGFAWAKCDTRFEVEHTLYNFAAYCIGEKMVSPEEFRTLDPLKEH